VIHIIVQTIILLSKSYKKVLKWELCGQVSFWGVFQNYCGTIWYCFFAYPLWRQCYRFLFKILISVWATAQRVVYTILNEAL